MGTPLPPWPQLLFDEWRAKNAIRHQVTNGDEWQMPFVASRHQEKIDKPNSSPNDERQRTRKPFDTKWRKATNEKNVRHQMTNGDERKKSIGNQMTNGDEREKSIRHQNDERRRTKKKWIRHQMTNGDERQKHDSTLSDERWRAMKAVRHSNKWWKLIVFIPSPSAKMERYRKMCGGHYKELGKSSIFGQRRFFSENGHVNFPATQMYFWLRLEILGNTPLYGLRAGLHN